MIQEFVLFPLYPRISSLPSAIPELKSVYSIRLYECMYRNSLG